MRRILRNSSASKVGLEFLRHRRVRSAETPVQGSKGGLAAIYNGHAHHDGMAAAMKRHDAFLAEQLGPDMHWVALTHSGYASYNED